MLKSEKCEIVFRLSSFVHVKMVEFHSLMNGNQVITSREQSHENTQLTFDKFYDYEKQTEVCRPCASYSNRNSPFESITPMRVKLPLVLVRTILRNPFRMPEVVICVYTLSFLIYFTPFPNAYTSLSTIII